MQRTDIASQLHCCHGVWPEGHKTTEGSVWGAPLVRMGYVLHVYTDVLCLRLFQAVGLGYEYVGTTGFVPTQC